MADTTERQSLQTSKRAWLVVAIFLGFANVVRALYFDWSDIGIHLSLAALLGLMALRWPKGAALAATVVLLTSVFAFAFASAPSDWAEVEVGDAWIEVRRTLGPPVHEAANLDQARALARGYSSPSPMRFRQTGAVAIYIRGDQALWLFHDGNIVEAKFIGGS